MDKFIAWAKTPRFEKFIAWTNVVFAAFFAISAFAADLSPAILVWYWFLAVVNTVFAYLNRDSLFRKS